MKGILAKYINPKELRKARNERTISTLANNELSTAPNSPQLDRLRWSAEKRTGAELWEALGDGLGGYGSGWGDVRQPF